MSEPAAGYDGFIGWVLTLMETLGELGVGIAILLETFLPPIPSEAVLPGAGFLAYDGRMNFWLAWAAATLGALAGAWIWYAVGAALGRDRTRRLVGRIPLLDHEDFDKSEAFFNRWGGVAVLVGRCVPLVRSFISIPAGIERMSFAHFTAYTLIGSGCGTPSGWAPVTRSAPRSSPHWSGGAACCPTRCWSCWSWPWCGL